MSISKITGLSAETVVRRQDSVVAGVPLATARRRGFESKLAAADQRLTAAGEPARPVPNRKPAATAQPKTSAAPAATVNAGQASPGKYIEKLNTAELQRHPAQATAAALRKRRRKSATPEYVRKKFSQFATELGLTIVDVWSDPTQHSVTLVVEQQGFSATRFVIEHDKTIWHVAIQTEVDADRNQLLDAEEALQARFETVDLGRVIVDRSRD